MRIATVREESRQHLEARFGFYEGTYALPAPYDEPTLQQVFAAGGRDVETFGKRAARIVLSDGIVEILRAFLNRPVLIPLRSVVAVFSSASVGGRYVGKDCVLKIVWRRDGHYLCTAVRLGPGQSAAEWKRTIEIEAETAVPSSHPPRPSPRQAARVA